MEAQGRASLLAPMAETHLWRQIFRSQFQATPPSHGSWEEKAFAEDTAGPLGGSVWPPRSYSCNFCMREFRSAQALGGHMNVHRRDRARLQQSIIGSHVENLHDQNDPNRPFTTGRLFTSSTARVSMNQSEWADAVGFKVVGGVVGKKQEEGGYSSSSPRLPYHEKPAGFNLETDSSVKNRSASGFCGDEANILSSKRAKVSVSSVSSCSDIYRSNTISGSSEELDLELRLGSDPPKVN